MKFITERQWVTIGLYALTGILLAMAAINPALWDNDRFNAILQAVVLTGLLNLVGAFHFSGNQSSAKATDNTGEAFKAITAAANAGSRSDAGTDAGEGARRTADAADEEATKIEKAAD